MNSHLNFCQNEITSYNRSKNYFRTKDMQQKADMASNTMTAGGSLVTMLSGAWVWLGNNHVQIAALCAIVGAIVGIGGFLYGVHHKRQVRKILAEKESFEDIPAYIIDQLERRKPYRNYHKQKNLQE